MLFRKALCALSFQIMFSFNGFAAEEHLIATLRDTAYINADQYKRLDEYVRELKLYDITINVPDSMRSIDIMGRQFICQNISKNWTDAQLGNDVCTVALETDSGDAVYLFPMLLFAWPKQALRTAYCVGTELRMNNKDIDISDNVEIITNTDKRQYSGADTIMVYKLEFEIPFAEKYKHCVGVYLRSHAHNALPLKIALTENGLKNVDSYIETLYRMIEIGSSPHPDFLKAEEETKGDRDLY